MSKIKPSAHCSIVPIMNIIGSKFKLLVREILGRQRDAGIAVHGPVVFEEKELV